MLEFSDYSILMFLKIVIIILANCREHDEMGIPSLSNSLGLPVDQAGHFVGPGLDPNISRRHKGSSIIGQLGHVSKVAHF